MDVFEIKGKFNTAVCYAKVIEPEAVEQIRRMCDYPFTVGSRIRIMPDVHAGKGCTIGTTMTVTDKAVPNVVGVDIGCGMYTVNLGKIRPDLPALDRIAHRIPSGFNVWDRPKECFELTELKCFRNLKDSRRLENSLGTLGGGNHFIEMDSASDGTVYLVIHSGSRNLGKQVAEHYQQLAIELAGGRAEFIRKREALIAEYKSSGKAGELQNALKAMAWDTSSETPDDLCFVSGESFADYLHDVKLCQRFATKNRELMGKIILEGLGLTAKDAFHTVHNYIDTDEMILRKGAVAAHEGERLLIPINMRDGSVLAVGRGNEDWNWSAPHGAGRLMSRTAARETLDLAEYRKAMEGIYTTSVSPATIDEAPMAYKSLDDIIDVIRETVDIVDIMKPIYNFKAE